MDLTQKKCVACEGGIPPLGKEGALPYLPQVPEWKPNAEYTAISREFLFDDFKGSLAFVNKVGEIAEKEGHHPDIHVFYNRVRLELSTHALSGLSESDFILAAKIDRI